MPCEYGQVDCANENNKCYLCYESSFYVPKKVKTHSGLKKKINPNTKRQGSMSEVINHNQNKRMLDAITSGTPNSGAGKIKGDEQITGLIRIMEEIKTTTTKNLNRMPGKESFTIQREWLDKLEAEAKAENMEFGYLKFSFKEHSDKFYIVANADVFMDMVATMVHDRRELSIAKAKADTAEKLRRSIEAENIALKAKIDYYESLENLQNIISKEEEE